MFDELRLEEVGAKIGNLGVLLIPFHKPTDSYIILPTFERDIALRDSHRVHGLPSEPR